MDHDALPEGDKAELIIDLARARDDHEKSIGYLSALSQEDLL